MVICDTHQRRAVKQDNTAKAICRTEPQTVPDSRSSSEVCKCGTAHNQDQVSPLWKTRLCEFWQAADSIVGFHGILRLMKHLRAAVVGTLCKPLKVCCVQLVLPAGKYIVRRSSPAHVQQRLSYLVTSLVTLVSARTWHVKSRVGSHAQVGKCRKGTLCSFAHGQARLLWNSKS